MFAAEELVVLLLIGRLQGGRLVGCLVKANLQLFYRMGSIKCDENLNHGAKVMHGCAKFGHWGQEKHLDCWAGT